MDSHIPIPLQSTSLASTPSQNSAPHTPSGFPQKHVPFSSQSSSALPSYMTSISSVGSSPASANSVSSTNTHSPSPHTILQNSTQHIQKTAAKKNTNTQPNLATLPPLPPGAKERIPPKSSVIKTDKPRPHVCTICTRSFARLEHLKRHERSHTKEKPFQCPVCERCFARRDLLLRHRQKLHASFPQDPPRPRGGNKRKAVAANSNGAGIPTKTSAGVTKASTAAAATTTGSANAAAAAAAVVNGKSNNNNNTITPTPSVATSNPSTNKQPLSKSESRGHIGTSDININSPINTHTPSANTPGSVTSNGPNFLDFSKQMGIVPTHDPSAPFYSPFSTEQSPANSQNSNISNTSFTNMSFLLQNSNSHLPSDSSVSNNDLQSNIFSLPNTFQGISDGLENNYGDFYGLVNSASPSALNNLVSSMPNSQFLSANQMAFETHSTLPNDQHISSVAATVSAASQHSFPKSNRGNKFGNETDFRARRNRPASFSAASATSYSKYKDIAQMDLQENISSECPQQVSFATPQLGPTALAENDGDVPPDNFFSSNDPLFINPQLLDPSFDSNFFLSTSFANDADNQYNLHDSKFSNVQPDLSPSHNSLLELDNTDLSWLYPKANKPETFGPTESTTKSVPKPSLFDKNYSFGNVQNVNGTNSMESNSNKIMNQMARGNLANSSNAKPMLEDQSSWGFNGNMGPGNHNRASFGVGNNQQFDAQMMDNSNAFVFDKNHNTFLNNQSNSLNNLGVNFEDSSAQYRHRITPQLRAHIMNTLSMPTPFTTIQTQFLPSTEELQLYVDAYVSNFDKHLPFLHQNLEFNNENVALALGMAAVGALYLFERQQSAAIFEVSRCCVHVYLESRRERKLDSEHETTPLWLVQSLLLGVIYGLFNEELLANEIAVAQADAVISLAKSAGLHLPPGNFIPAPNSPHITINDKWQYFVKVQERIRTMHVVHTISCLLATGYNVVTKLKNSDIRCGSPCDETLWRASSADAWWSIIQQKENDGVLDNVVGGLDFTECLSRLLSGNTLVGEVPHFTLLTLIYAIHSDIHERRLAHDKFVAQNPLFFSKKIGNKVPDPRGFNEESELHWLEKEKQRTESVLRAWETTWSLSPHASLIPKTADGSLISDSIPMSSLAHVRLYLDLRKTKQCFWKRDFSGMGRELDLLAAPVLSDSAPGGRKHFDALLEAASYAADTISLWEKHASRWSLQMTALETFLHSTMSLFDCGLVVSEFFHRLEKRDTSTWQEDERLLVKRLTKIFFRVFDVLFVRPDNDVLHNQHQRTNGLGNSNTTGGSDPDLINMLMDGSNMNNGNMGTFNNAAANNDNSNVMMMMMQQQIPMSIIALTAVSRILSTVFVWPFSLIMSQALRARIMQIRSETMTSNNSPNADTNNMPVNPMSTNTNVSQVQNLMNLGFNNGNFGPNANSTSPSQGNPMAMNGGNMGIPDSAFNNDNSNRNAGHIPLNIVNMANLMTQLGVGNFNNINVSQLAALLNQMKQVGVLENLASAGNINVGNTNNHNNNNNGNNMDSLAFLQQHMNYMNQGNGYNAKNNDVTNSDESNASPNVNTPGLIGNYLNDQRQQHLQSPSTNSLGNNVTNNDLQKGSSMSPLNNQMSPVTPSPSTGVDTQRSNSISPMN